MPRKAKPKKNVTGMDAPTAVAETLETLKEEIPGLKAAVDLPRQLPDPRADIPPEHRELITTPERDPVRQQPDQKRDDLDHNQAEPGPHAAAVLARRPKMQPTPPGFFGIASDREAGIRVSKSSDHKLAAIQFSEDRLPERAEKDILERVGQPEDGQNFSYKTQRRQWERPVPEGWTSGENSLDAVRVMQELAAGRNEGRER